MAGVPPGRVVTAGWAVGAQELSPYQQTHRLVELPTPLATVSYLFGAGNLLAGGRRPLSIGVPLYSHAMLQSVFDRSSSCCGWLATADATLCTQTDTARRGPIPAEPATVLLTNHACALSDDAVQLQFEATAETEAAAAAAASAACCHRAHQLASE